MTKTVEAKVQEFEDQWKKVDAWVDEIRQERVIRPPENSFTSEDYAKRAKCSVGQARKLLVQLVRKGNLKATRVGSRHYYTFAE